MKKFNFQYKIIVQIFFVIIFLFTSQAKSLDKFNKADRIADYFSGILLLNDNKYSESLRYLKRFNGLEINHKGYPAKYLYSLVNSGNFKEAINFSNKLEKKKLSIFESYLVLGIFNLKNSNYQLAQNYFIKAKNLNSRFVLNNYIIQSLYNWSKISNLKESSDALEKLDNRFENLKKLQNVFLNCYFNNLNTSKLYTEILSDQNTDFSRYNYFYAAFVASTGNIDNAKEIIDTALQTHPRNLLLNQYKIELKKNTNVLRFNCKKQEHVAAEILYITANALSSQSIYPQSNFFLNLAKYLNKDFHSYDTLLAENFYKNNDFEKAKRIYNNLGKNGQAYNWYSSKQLAKILIQDDNKSEALKLLSKSYNSLLDKKIYETFDYAEFLKNNEKFREAISYYTEIINKINNEHPLYSEATDGRGVSYERIGEWQKAEKDLLSSLETDPDQAYVINYLAYSWIEQGVKVKKSLSMLEKANKLRSNDPYITDSLGWALFKLEKFKEAKSYLQLAVSLLPADPIVNDHYGDVLWKNGNKIQARYYWKYVLNLEKTEEKQKKIIEKKLINGL
jgi:tetratricopeptide (TPR) repeat protein